MAFRKTDLVVDTILSDRTLATWGRAGENLTAAMLEKFKTA
ncbi:hypothetical protein [Rhizobium leguminosarum]|nr:hypothetical protein [Rhizobium leguminosarum]